MVISLTLFVAETPFSHQSDFLCVRQLLAIAIKEFVAFFEETQKQ